MDPDRKRKIRLVVALAVSLEWGWHRAEVIELASKSRYVRAAGVDALVLSRDGGEEEGLADGRGRPSYARRDDDFMPRDRRW